jgi:hypothetical protein
MAYAKQPVTIDGIAFDALIDSSETWEAESPSYPVEEGFEVSDTIILKPLTLRMTLFLTNTPVTWRQRHGSSPSRVQNVLKQLEALYFKKTPVTVTTSERTYKNMAILSIELTKTLETGSSREIPITFREIRVTESKTTTIPDSYGKSGATGINAGTASTTASNTPAASAPAATASSSSSSSSASGSKGSALYGLASGAGLL